MSLGFDSGGSADVSFALVVRFCMLHGFFFFQRYLVCIDTLVKMVQSITKFILPVCEFRHDYNIRSANQVPFPTLCALDNIAPGYET